MLRSKKAKETKVDSVYSHKIRLVSGTKFIKLCHFTTLVSFSLGISLLLSLPFVT